MEHIAVQRSYKEEGETIQVPDKKLAQYMRHLQEILSACLQTKCYRCTANKARYGGQLDLQKPLHPPVSKPPTTGVSTSVLPDMAVGFPTYYGQSVIDIL